MREEYRLRIAREIFLAAFGAPLDRDTKMGPLVSRHHRARVLEHIETGRGAHNLFLSPDQKILWVNNRAGGTTVSLDSNTLQPIRSYAIPGGPDDMDFAPDGKIWITRRWAEKVAVLDPATGTYQTIAVGRSPHGLFLNPNGPSPTVVSSR